MIILDHKCVSLEKYLTAFFAALPDPRGFTNMKFSDYDDTQIEFQYVTPESFEVIVRWDCIDTFVQNGSRAILEEIFKDFKMEINKRDLTVSVELAKIPEDAAGRTALIEKLSCIKYHIFSGPFLRIMHADKAAQSSIEPLQIEVKPSEYMWIIPTPTGGFTCGFSHRVSDKTDLPIARVIYHEFNDSRRDMSLNASPAAISSAERPKDLEGMKYDTGMIDGYFLFTVTPKHYQTPKLEEKLIGQMLVFRSYLDYHFKCTKAFTHYRMRYCHDNLVQVVNRAKGEIKIGRGTKTFSGRTMKQLS